MAGTDLGEALGACLKELHLPAFRSGYEELARQARQEGRQRRVERLLRESRLPQEKSWPALDLRRLPPKVVQQARSLLDGSFLARRENVLAFGPPGSGKPQPA